MSRIAIIGATGFTGSNLVRVAAQRGHDVLAVSRSAPAELPDGVTHLQLDVTAPEAAEQVVRPGGVPVDAVVSALSPRGVMAGQVAPADLRLAEVCREAGVRFAVVGGFGSLRPQRGAPRVAEGEDFPEAYRPEALEMAGLLDALAGGAPDLDWLYVSPSAGYGAFAPGEATGSYRWGGDVVTPDAGEISGADFALGLIEELEVPSRAGHVSLFA